jgi:hypothetical protein
MMVFQKWDSCPGLNVGEDDGGRAGYGVAQRNDAGEDERVGRNERHEDAQEQGDADEGEHEGLQKKSAARAQGSAARAQGSAARAQGSAARAQVFMAEMLFGTASPPTHTGMTRHTS